MKQNHVWIRLTSCESIPLREGRAVEIAGREIAIFNLGERYLAIDNRCPHRSGPLADGIVSGNTVVCPLHAWKFSLETGAGANAASAANCVNTYPTRVENGLLWLQFPLSARQDGEPSDVWMETSEHQSNGSGTTLAQASGIAP